MRASCKKPERALSSVVGVDLRPAGNDSTVKSDASRAKWCAPIAMTVTLSEGLKLSEAHKPWQNGINY